MDNLCFSVLPFATIWKLDEAKSSEVPVNIKEAEILVKVALLCTNASPSLRPIVSKVVSMLEGRMTVLDMSPEPCTYSDDLRFKAMRDLRRQRENQSLNRSQTQNSTKVHTPIKKEKSPYILLSHYIYPRLF